MEYGLNTTGGESGPFNEVRLVGDAADMIAGSTTLLMILPLEKLLELCLAPPVGAAKFPLAIPVGGWDDQGTMVLILDAICDLCDFCWWFGAAVLPQGKGDIFLVWNRSRQSFMKDYL